MDNSMQLEYLNRQYFYHAHYYKTMEPLLKLMTIGDRLRIIEEKIIMNTIKLKQTIILPHDFSINFIRCVVRKVLPYECFGSSHNFKYFFKHIINLCTSSSCEAVPLKGLIYGWNFENVEWLKNVDNKETILVQFVIWMIEYTKIKILRMFYYIQKDIKTYKIIFTSKRSYSRIMDKARHSMIKQEQLIPSTDVQQQKLTKQSYSVLTLCPKPDLKSYRPIIRTKILSDKKIRQRITPHLYGRGLNFNRELYSSWQECVRSTENQILFGIKMDLEDAFSNINIDELKGYIDLFVEDEISKAILLNTLNTRLVRFGKQFYIWNRGLMQGMRISQCLCNLSRSIFDARFLKNSKKGVNFYHRSVDDYFLCSVKAEHLNSFQQIMQRKCKIATHKTETNLYEKKNIVYYGRIFDLEAKEVLSRISCDSYRFKSSKFFTLQSELNTYLGNINSFKSHEWNFNRLLINVNYNSQQTVLNNYFKAMLELFFKMDCALSLNFIKPPKLSTNYILMLVKNYVAMVRRRLIKTKKNIEKPLGIPRRVMKIIGIKACILVFQKRYNTYSKIIIALKKILKTDVKECFYNETNHLVGTRYEKLPDEFKAIEMKRYPSKFS